MSRVSNIFSLLTIFLLISQCRPLKAPAEPIKIINYDKSAAKVNINDAKQSVKEAIESLRGKVVAHKSQQTLAKDDEEYYDSLDDIQYANEGESLSPVVRGKKNIKQWDHWGKWSSCSVSCGVGKMTRWRHCVSEGCADGEKEAQIKTCTMGPCP